MGILLTKRPVKWSVKFSLIELHKIKFLFSGLYMNKIMEVEIPCCNSIRTCVHRALYVIGIRNPRKPRVLRKVEAVRCYKEGVKKNRIVLTNDILVVYERSTLTYTIIYKPDNISEELARTLVIRTLFDNPDETLVNKIAVSFQPLLN